jgi:DNA-binding PucR family transcriptional regulator
LNASGQPAEDREAEVAASRSAPRAVDEMEAELLVELAASAEASFAGHEETYRLLIGVLLRDREELELLRDRTISPLAAYDSEHDTELVVTLQTFLARDGSTTETAEAMNLHRHTVGYRLSRTQELSGLSPYESYGRERLSLGLKAQQILEAEKRRTERL